MRNFEARNGIIESNMLVQNQREQRHVLKGQGDCWQWKAIGQCPKGNNCSFRHGTNKRAKPTIQPAPSPEHSKSKVVKDSAKAKSPRGRSPSGKITRMSCKDHLKGTCANPFCEKWHRRVEEQSSKRSKRIGDKSAVALLKLTKNLGCVFQDVEPPRSSSILRKSSTTTKPIRCVSFLQQCWAMPNFETKTRRSTKLRNPSAPKFEDRSREETEWQEHWAREAAWNLAKKFLKLKEKHKATFFSPTETCCLPSPSQNLTGGRRVCCRLRGVDAYDKQKGSEFCRAGDCEDFQAVRRQS